MSGIRGFAALAASLMALMLGLAACDQSAQQGGETPPPAEQPSQQ